MFNKDKCLVIFYRFNKELKKFCNFKFIQMNLKKIFNAELYSRENLTGVFLFVKNKLRTAIKFFFKESPILSIRHRTILWASLAFCFIAVLWSAFAMIDEVTRGEGKVIPSSQVQIIQNLEGGIIGNIYVHEGQVVQKGQVLMQLDKTRFESTFRETEAKLCALKIKIIRLTAESQNNSFVIPQELEKKYPEQANFQKALYQSRQEELKQLNESFKLSQQELDLNKPLVAKGAVSPAEVIRLERTTSDLKKEINKFKSDTLRELNDTRSEIAVLEESKLADQDRLSRTTIKSPVKGIVKQIKIMTIGGVSQPGMELMEIVPLDDTLLIEAKILPKDIGFIHPGQKAQVKITAYDSAIYGGLQGVVEQISADAIQEEKQPEKSYYLVRVRTPKNYLGTNEKPLYIIPGMTATVEILTGKKSVLHYLLKPIIKAKDNALTEK